MAMAAFEMRLANPVWRRLALALAASALLHVGLGRLIGAPSFLPYLASAEGGYAFKVRIESRPAETGDAEKPATRDERELPARQTHAADGNREAQVGAAGQNQLIPLQALHLDYPVSYRGMSISAYVVLDLQLAPDGSVSDLKVVDVFPPEYGEFGQAALEGFSGARFAVQPGAERPSYRIRVEFTPEPPVVPE